MRYSLKDRIIKFAESKEGWVNGIEFERLALENGYKASNAGRRCRELATDKYLLRNEGKSVSYRVNPEKKYYFFRIPDEEIMSNPERLRDHVLGIK